MTFPAYPCNISIVLIFILLISNFGCNPKNDVCNTKIVNLAALQQIDVIPISNGDYVDSYSVIKLQSSDKSIINQIDQIQVFEDHLYILDRNQDRLLVFNSKGEYMRDIGRKGRAGNEFIAIGSFYINPEKRTVNLVDPMKNSVLSYDLTGTFIDVKVAAFEALGPIASIRYLGNGKIICFSNPNVFDDKMLFLVDENEFSVDHIITNSSFAPGVGAYEIAIQPYSIVGGDLHFIAMFDKEVRTYSDNTVSPILLLEDGNDKLDKRKLKTIARRNANDYFKVIFDVIENNRYSLGFQNLFETDRFVLCTSVFNPGIIWDKHNEQGCIIKSRDNSYPGLNDISYSEGNTLIKIWTSSQIKQFKSGIDDGRIKINDYESTLLDVIDAYDENEDNPILFVIQMKI